MHGIDFQFLLYIENALFHLLPHFCSSAPPLPSPPCLFHFVTHSTCLLAISPKLSRIIQQATTTFTSTVTRLQDVQVLYMYKGNGGRPVGVGWGTGYRWSSAQFNLKLSNVVVEWSLVAHTVWHRLENYVNFRCSQLSEWNEMRLTARLPAWSKEEKDLVQCQGAETGTGRGQVASASLHRLKIVWDASRRRRRH